MGAGAHHSRSPAGLCCRLGHSQRVARVGAVGPGTCWESVWVHTCCACIFYNTSTWRGLAMVPGSMQPVHAQVEAGEQRHKHTQAQTYAHEHTQVQAGTHKHIYNHACIHIHAHKCEQEHTSASRYTQAHPHPPLHSHPCMARHTCMQINRGP